VQRLQSILFALAVATVAVCLILLTGCPPKPPLPPVTRVDLSATDTARCSAPIGRPVPCDGLFRPDGTPCAVCPGNDGCFYQPAAIYCVRGGCGDAACRLEVPDVR
jgi:hypothetical protein